MESVPEAVATGSQLGENRDSEDGYPVAAARGTDLTRVVSSMYKGRRRSHW